MQPVTHGEPMTQPLLPGRCVRCDQRVELRRRVELVPGGRAPVDGAPNTRRYPLAWYDQGTDRLHQCTA
jgi:hypothetical protein